MISHFAGGRRAPLFLAGMLTLLLASGCGSRTQPVEGLVTFPGDRPATQLQGYTVTFESDEEPVSATGEIRADGSFQVGTFRDGDGAVLGRHRVAITPPVPTGDGPVVKSRIAARYRTLEGSGLEVTIIRGKNQVTLQVEPAP